MVGLAVLVAIGWPFVIVWWKWSELQVRLNLRRHGVITTGRVVSVESTWYGEGSVFRSTIEYEDRSGATHTYEKDGNDGRGSTVTLAYDPDDPSEVRVWDRRNEALAKWRIEQAWNWLLYLAPSWFAAAFLIGSTRS